MPLLNLTGMETALGSPEPITGVVTLRYVVGSRGFAEIDGEKVILPKPITVAIVAGQPIEPLHIEPTRGVCALEAKVSSKTGAYLRKCFEVPDVPSIDIGALDPVDPDTFLPLDPVPPSAQQVLETAVEAVAATEAAVDDALLAADASSGFADDAEEQSLLAQGFAQDAQDAADSVIPTTDAAMTTVANDPASTFAIAQKSTIGAAVAGAVVPGIVDLVTNGDSLTEALQDDGVPWSKLLENWLGITARNPAVSGEAPNDISFRQGALAPAITLAGNQIPAATTPVAITSVSPGGSGWRSNAVGTSRIGVFDNVVIAGVRGRVVHTQTAGSDGGWTFTPTVAPLSVISVPPNSRMRVDSGNASRSAIHTIWSGRNYPDITTVTREVDRMIAFVEPVDGEKRFLVLTVVPTNSANDTAALNAALVARYPANILDVVSHLRAHGLTEAGLTETSGDTADLAAGLIPRSLRVSATDLHLNRYGKLIVARLIALRVLEEGWVSPSSVFVPAPAADPDADTWLALPTVSSSQATIPSPAPLSAVTADFSFECIFAPRVAVPTGPIGLVDRQSVSLANSAWQIYLFGNGNLRFQAITNAGTTDYRDSTGGTAWPAVGEDAAIRIDYQASTNSLRMYRGTIDGSGVVTWGSPFFTASMNSSTNNTTAAAPVRLRGAAVDVKYLRIQNFARNTVYLEEDFTDGSAAGWTLASGAVLESAPWPWT